MNIFMSEKKIYSKKRKFFLFIFTFLVYLFGLYLMPFFYYMVLLDIVFLTRQIFTVILFNIYR